MYVPSYAYVQVLCWFAAIFFAVWGIMIGRRADRLARRVAFVYGLIAIGLHLPLLLALGRPIALHHFLCSISILLALASLLLGLQAPVE